MALNIWGTDCNFVKVIGNKIQSVKTQDGNNESKLYKDILEEIKKLPEEKLDVLKERYRSWEGEYIHSVDDPKHLALAIYGQTKSDNFIKEYKGGKDDLGEPIAKEVMGLLTPTKKDVLKQKPGTEGSKMSPSTKAKYEEFIDRVGFKIGELSNGIYDKDGNQIKPNAIVDFLHKLILVSKGKEASIGEEASHVAVRMIKQQDPALFKQMLNEVGKYNLYFDVLTKYKEDPNYQLPDGKPNLPLIKEETIGKIFNELVINRLEGETEKPELLAKAQTLWDKVKNFFRNLVSKIGFDPSEDAIDKAAKQFVQGDKNFENTEEYKKLTDTQKLKYELQKTIIGTSQDRGSQTENTKKLSGTGRSLEESASNYLATKEGEYSKNVSRGKNTNPTRFEEKPDQQDLVDFINNNNLWFKWDDSLHKTGQGSEAEVFATDNDKDHIIKTNNGIYYKTWKDYLDHLQLHNFLFPESAMELQGFISDDMGLIQSVVKQKYLHTKANPNNERVISYMKDIGFEKIGDFDYENKELGLTIHDLHRANVVVEPNGNLFFIDTQIFTTPDFYQLVDKSMMFQLSDTPDQDNIHEKLTEDIGLVKKEQDNFESFYEIKGKKVLNRVTQYAKKYLEGIFKNKPWLKDKIDAAIQDQKKQFGVGGHKDMEQILSRGIDKETNLRKTDKFGNFRIDPKDGTYTSTVDPKNEGYYHNLEKYLFGENDESGTHIPGLIDLFPKGSKFYWEKMIYDPNRDLAGTIDFMVVEPDGKTHLFDWKFIGSLEQNQAIRDYMKTSYDKQMDNYVDILKKNYGVKEIGQVRIVPISVKYSEKKGEEGNYVSLKIGNVDYKSVSEKDYYLLPYITSSEKSLDKNINTLVQRLTGLMQQIKDKTENKSEDIIKLQKVHDLEKSLLFIRLANSFEPFLSQVKTYNQEGLKKLKDLAEKYTKINFDGIKPQEASELIAPLNELMDDLDIFRDIEQFTSYFDTKTPEGKKLGDELLEQEKNAKELYREVKKLHGQYFSSIYKNKTPQDILDPQKKLETIGAWGRPLSKSQLTTSQIFYKINDYRQHIVENQTNDVLNTLDKLQEGLKTWGAGRGLSGGADVTKAYTNLIEKKDAKGQGINRLISQIDKGFYTELDQRINKKEPSAEDIKWIKSNVDQQAFKAWADEYKLNRYQQIKDLIIPGKEEEVEQKKENMRNQVDRVTDYNKDYAWLQPMNVRRFPKTDIWHSKEYKELLKPENKAVKDLYDFMLETNELATKHGYIESKEKKSFLPWIEKSLAEKFVLGGKWNALQHFKKSISVTEGAGDNEKLDAKTGKLLPQLPKYFTREISETKGDERDYSMVSDEMLKNAAIYRYEVLDYNTKKELEELVQGLLNLEKYKGMLASTSSGRLTDMVVENISNAEMLEKQIRQMFYDQSILTSFDIKSGKVKIGDQDRVTSGQKLLNTVKTVYAMDVLGFNAVTSIFRSITTNLSGLYTADQYYNQKQFLEGLWDFAAMRMFKDDHKLMIGMLKDFLPVEENLHEGLNELSATKASGADFQRILMKWVQAAHNIVQYSNFNAHMKNAIIMNGKLINAREYYRNSEEYKNRYTKTESERKEIEKGFENKVKELIDKNGLINKSKFNEQTGRVEYEGLDFNDASVADLKSTIRVMGRKLSGNISENDESLIRSNALARQMFLFTNWLPQAIDTHFGGLAYNEGLDRYEWGRTRLMGKILFGEGIIPKVGKLIKMARATEGGVQELHKLYTKKVEEYKKETGQDLKMTPEEFYDLVRQNLKIQGRELLTLLSVATLAMSAAALLPKKDEDPDHQGYYTFAKRILNRSQDELELFYNPASFIKFADSSKFPMLAYLVNLKKASTSILQEVYGFTIQDDKIMDNAHVIKNTLGPVPVFKEGLEVINILDPDMGNYLGMHYSSEIMGSQGKK